MPKEQTRTDESPEAAVRKHCPPQAAGEDARQNCVSQTFVICVAADASGMAANATSRTARSSILTSRCRARPVPFLRTDGARVAAGWAGFQAPGLPSSHATGGSSGG